MCSPYLSSDSVGTAQEKSSSHKGEHKVSPYVVQSVSSVWCGHVYFYGVGLDLGFLYLIPEGVPLFGRKRFEVVAFVAGDGFHSLEALFEFEVHVT